MILKFISFIFCVLCFFYGTALYMMHSGSRFYLFFFLLGICVIGLNRLFSHGYQTLIPVPVRNCLLALAFLVLASVVIIEGCILKHAHDKAPGGLDAIIVLGAQVWPSGPSLSLRYRLDAAYDYLINNEKTFCIVSGGQGDNEPWPEAEAMAQYLMEKGIAPGRIRKESASTNTWENLVFSGRLLSPENDRVGIVSNDFHIFRALHLAKKAGYSHTFGMPAASAPFSLPANALREYFAVIKAFLSH